VGKYPSLENRSTNSGVGEVLNFERIVILKVESLWKKFDIKLDIHSGNSS